MATQREKLEFVARLAKEASATQDSEIVTVALRLMRLATTYHTLAELACNQELNQWQLNRQRRTEADALKLCASLGLKGIIFNADPRAAVFKLLFHSGKTNDFGNEGYCVPLNGRH